MEIQKLEYLENEKSFLGEKEKHFSYFLKGFKKIVDTSFKDYQLVKKMKTSRHKL